MGSYTENSLKWFNYPHARAHPWCEVSCHGTEWTCIVGSSVIRQGQSNSGESWIVLQSGPTRSVQLSLAVREFHPAGEECCKRGHEWVCANLWCLMSCRSADLRIPSDSLRENLAWWAVTRRTLKNHKTVKIRGWVLAWDNMVLEYSPFYNRFVRQLCDDTRLLAFCFFYHTHKHSNPLEQVLLANHHIQRARKSFYSSILLSFLS